MADGMFPIDESDIGYDGMKLVLWRIANELHNTRNELGKLRAVLIDIAFGRMDPDKIKAAARAALQRESKC